MTRDPLALRIGALVTTPNGIGTVRARRCGPITTWLVMDFWWRESQLEVVEDREPIVSTALCRSCRLAQHNTGMHCYGDGGVVVDGTPATCGCWCAGGLNGGAA